MREDQGKEGLGGWTEEVGDKGGGGEGLGGKAGGMDEGGRKDRR